MYLFIVPQKQQKSKDFFLAIPNFFHFLSLPKVANSGGGNHASTIAVMLEYKKKFTLQNTTVEGTEQLGNVVAYCNLDTQEAALLWELFQG